MTHTQTPWKTDTETGDNGGRVRVIRTKDFKYILDGGYISEENAAYIVECVNGFEALKAQRDELADMLAKALPFVEEQMTDEGYKSVAVEKYTESIRAILAKVTL